MAEVKFPGGVIHGIPVPDTDGVANQYYDIVINNLIFDDSTYTFKIDLEAFYNVTYLDEQQYSERRSIGGGVFTLEPITGNPQ